MRSARILCCIALLGISFVAPARADSPTVAYDLAMPTPANHVFKITMTVAGLARDRTTVQMPIWIPGYYSDNHYGRNVLTFSATDAGGNALPWRQDGDTAWAIDTHGVSSLSVHYDLYADRVADVGTQLTTQRALFNGAETFMYVEGDDGYPVAGPTTLTIHKPAGWDIASGLLAMQTAPDTYTAPSYDVLVDCPTDMTPHLLESRFVIQGVTYHLVIDGPGNYDIQKMTDVARRIIGSEVKMMGHAGYKEYWAIMSTVGPGGMEHLNSTISGINEYGWEQQRDPDDATWDTGSMDGFAFVLAHEHFHSWNVKRIRPQILGPFRYDREDHTRRLDVAEGFTEYYTYIHVMRSGYATPKGMFVNFADAIDTEENSPGRKIFSLGDLSWNTWWANDAPWVPGGDYYSGAAAMALMLDLKIRHDTNDAHSLDDVLRYLFADWDKKALDQYRSPGGTYADDELPSIIAKATGDAEAGALFHTWFDTTTLPNWNMYLAYAGLRLSKTLPSRGAPSLGAQWNEIGAPDGLGFEGPGSKLNDGLPSVNPDAVMITSVDPDGAAEQAGIEQYDVLQSLDGLAVTKESLPALLATYRAGARMKAVVLREGRQVSLDLTLGQDTHPKYEIENLPDATAKERALMDDFAVGKPFGQP
jgi:predicted metalloprotease with PDZ domain